MLGTLPSNPELPDEIITEAEDTIEKPNIGADLANKIEEKQIHNNNLLEKIVKISKDVADEEKDKIHEEADLLRNGAMEKEKFLSQYPVESLPNQYAKLYLDIIQVNQEINDLQEQHKPYKIQEATQLAQDISNRFDWDAFLDYYDFDYTGDRYEIYKQDQWDYGIMLNALETVAAVRNINRQSSQGTITQESYGALEGFINHINANANEWEKRGFLSTTPVTSNETEVIEATKEKHQKLNAQITQIMQTIQNYNNIKSKYRSLTTRYKFRDKLFGDISYTLNNNAVNEETSMWKKYDYDPRYLDAVERFIEKRRQKYIEEGTLPKLDNDYNEYIDNLQETNLENALSRMSISGFEEREGEYLVVTEEALRQEFRTTVPACFLNNIEFVVVTDRPKDLDKDDPTVETIGRYIPDYDDKGNLIKSRIEIYTSPRVPETSGQKIRSVAERRFYATALHEVAHSIHSELTYVDLEEWERVREQDSTEITWYVEYMKKKDEKLLPAEDFCETFQTTVMDPLYLYVFSPSRYKYMINLISKHMGNEQMVSFIKSNAQMFGEEVRKNERLSQIINENPEKEEVDD
jgi:hypothetical protein